MSKQPVSAREHVRSFAPKLIDLTDNVLTDTRRCL